MRESAAVLLTRGSGRDLEVLLVRRSSKLAFFGGFWALPGGVVDSSDGDPVERETLRRCALRELFEETGVLALLAGTHGAERETMRDELLASEPRTERWTRYLDDAPQATSGLSDLGAFVTPAFSARRYRARYFHLPLPDGEAPRIREGELIDSRFLGPADALSIWRRGELPLASPVRSLLEVLADSPSIDEFRRVTRGAAVAMKSGVRRPVCNSPGIRVLPLATPTLPPATTTNCYMVGEQRVYVIDPATYDEGERQRLFDCLDQIGPDRLEAVIATHHHDDHVGSIAATSKRYDLPVHGHVETLDRLPDGFRRGEELADGETLSLGTAPDGTAGWQLEVLHTPGHDRGHVALRESRYGAIIAGDMVSTLSTIVIEPPEGHLATYLASLRRLRGLPQGFLYPAHGMVHPDSHKFLDRYLAHRAMREDRLVTLLGDRAVRVAALVPQVYADVDSSLHGLASRSLLAGLEKLEEEGRAVREGEGWRRA